MVSSDALSRVTSNERRYRYYLTGMFFLALALMLVGFSETTLSFATIWLDSTSNYGHGLLVFGLAVYCLWSRREDLQQALFQPRWPGLLLLACGSLLWGMAQLVSIGIVQQVVMVALLPVLVWTCFGSQVLRISLFSLLFIWLAVPIWDYLMPSLQAATARMSFAILQGLGVPAFREGNYITIPSGRFQIAEYCAGLRYLLAAISIGVFFAWQRLHGFRRQLFFVGLVVLVAIVANWLRVVTVMVAGHLTDMQSSLVSDHATMGWLMFAGFMFPVFWWGGRWAESLANGGRAHPCRRARSTGYSVPVLRSVWIFALLPVALFSGPLLVDGYSRQTVPASVASADWPDLPDRLGQWRRSEETMRWQPEFHGASHEWLATYRHEDQVIGLLVVYYAGQQQGSEIVYALNSTYNKKAWRRLAQRQRAVLLAGNQYRVVEEVLQAAHRSRLIDYWYDVGGQVVVSRIMTKLLELKRILQGKRGTALVAMAVDSADLPMARQRLDDFLQTAYPRLRLWLDALEDQ